MSKTEVIKLVEFDGYLKYKFPYVGKIYIPRVACGMPRRQRLLRKLFKRANHAELYAQLVADRWQSMNKTLHV